MPAFDNQRLYQDLLELATIPETKLTAALEQAEDEDAFLGDILLNQDLLARKDLTRLLAEELDVPFIFLDERKIDPQAAQLIPELVAQQHQVVAFSQEPTTIEVAMANPLDFQLKRFLEKKTGKKLKAYLALKQDIKDSWRVYAQDVDQAFDQLLTKQIEAASDQTDQEPPVISLVDTIFKYAAHFKASDIHLEPREETTLVRFRIDGVLHDIVKLPKELHPRLIMRIKLMAKLQTDEHQSAQDGKMQLEINQETIDLRVSIVPITEGEKVVIRLLSETARQFSLQDLGLTGSALKKVSDAHHQPQGMILATGPTGSGKTTTLYALLKLLNTKDVNIMTIEDPVEYEVERVNQIQVNQETELTFAQGLRSIVRQDPDVILVGEIRDPETASISVNSAMTGHLVLSSLHTNDAATTFPRMADMEVEPYLIASTVTVVIAQRLVRKICTSCRVSHPAQQYLAQKPELEKAFGSHFNENQRLYQGKGCPSCHNSGYIGRIGIFEVLEVSDAVQEAITNQSTADDIRQLAISEGMTTMFEDGLEKVKQGLTTIEEIMRVTEEK